MGPDTRARLYFWNGTEWELSENLIDVPEGWYVGTIDESVAGTAKPPTGDNF